MAYSHAQASVVGGNPWNSLLACVGDALDGGTCVTVSGAVVALLESPVWARIQGGDV
ncbi:hypothetical protein [Nonomuraea sp. 3-1Str]|uniref:hypothetical protein n=1 Tax=Nonomuraea sp. 3-1Str TaxID=2929801 RepID=UPI0028703711|nr:hypothetical protein [Nonomuraea sp. 3-1Str]